MKVPDETSTEQNYKAQKSKYLNLRPLGLWVTSGKQAYTLQIYTQTETNLK